MVHFSTGYLAGRALGYREYRFETLCMAVAAYAPDFDMQLQRLSPFFAHGVWTHTVLGVLAMSLVMATITAVLTGWLKPSSSIRFRRLWALALLGGMTHLVLDAFTFYESQADAIHHRYLWPIWNFPWHINTVFPGVSYSVRVWVEVVYCVFVFSFILLYQWGYCRQNPFRIFDPRFWFSSDEVSR
jgi:membrane-bound metal-dependent hydrolase YbcI (DUF457 family)